MKFLKGKRVYLAGPMHAASDDGVVWRKEITPILKKRYGLVVSNPSKKQDINGLVETKDDKQYFKSLIKKKDFDTLKNDFYPIVRKDLKEVDRADIIVAYYDPGIHMFGTIHEMIVASNQKKPILVKFDDSKTDDINPWLFTLIKSNWAFSEWSDMFSYLDTINKGELDSSHWW